MPYKVIFGKDKNGKYARSSERLHYHKYYYNTPLGRKRAIEKVKKQNVAILLSEIRRGKL